jgi:uncharacterized protein (DUF58 family)
MTVSGILGWLNIQGLKMQIEMPDEIYCGMATLVTIRLINTKRFFPSFLLKLLIFDKALNVNLMNRGGIELTSFLHTFAERGAMAIPFGAVCSPFPINFFVRCRRSAIDHQFLVFPAPLNCSNSVNPDPSRENGHLPASSKGYEGEVSRIGDYTGGEPLKMIHWRLSAKFEEFKVKELNATSREPVMLDLDALPGNDVESNLSCAVFLVNRLIRANRAVGLKLPDRVITPAASRVHRLRLLAELAVYGKH